MKTPQNRKAQVLQRQNLALYLRNQLYSQAEIARIMGATQSAVSKMLKRAEAAQQKKTAEAAERAKARISHQLEFLASQAADGWRRSVEGGPKIQTRENGDGKVLQTTREQRPPVGDPRFLANARGALSQVIALWRFDDKAAQPKPLTEKEKNLQEIDKFKARHATTEEIRAIEERQTREGFPPFPYPEEGKPLPEFPVIPPGWPDSPPPPTDAPPPTDNR